MLGDGLTMYHQWLIDKLTREGAIRHVFSMDKPPFPIILWTRGLKESGGSFDGIAQEVLSFVFYPNRTIEVFTKGSP